MSDVWTPDDIRAESRKWVSPWHPPHARHVVAADHELYVVGTHATVMKWDGPAAPGRRLSNVQRGAAAASATSLDLTVDADSAQVIDAVRAAGGVVVATYDVLACELPVPPPIVDPAISVLEVANRAQVVDFERASALGWGYPAPTETLIERAAHRLEPGSFIAYYGDTASGTGGFTLVGPVARCWGAAVIPALRGRGVYRSLVAHRLAVATARGATLALVHAAPTSSPILRRLGFQEYGARHTYRISL